MTTQMESISDLRMQRDAARAEAADLRRQLEQAQAVKISDLESCWPTANMAAHADAANARNEVAGLRRQLETAQLQRDAARDAVVGLQGERSALRALLEDERLRCGLAKNEAADLRRQVAEERQRANAAEFAVAQLREAAADLRQRLEDEKRRSVIAAHYSYTVIETMRKQTEQAAYYLLGYIGSYRLIAADTPATGEGE